MKYIVLILVIPISLYTFSFASYSWKRNEKIATVGATILGLASILLPLLTLITR